jgi:hypothetical protein
MRRRTSATEAAIASTLTASFAGSLSLDQAVELGAPPPQLTDARGWPSLPDAEVVWLWPPWPWPWPPRIMKNIASGQARSRSRKSSSLIGASSRFVFTEPARLPRCEHQARRQYG